MFCLHLFSDGREVLGSRMGCFPSWGGLCASFAQWLLPLCSSSRVFISPVSGRLLLFAGRDRRLVCDFFFFFFFWGGGGEGGICFSPFHFLLSYFLVSISLMFMFRLKAIVGGLGNRCCR